jgi:ribosomal RNA-processing protein 12
MEGVSKGRDPKLDSDEENQEHGEAGFERWLDGQIGNDGDVSTLWSALREILMSELKEESQMAVSLFALVLKTLKTLLDEHDKLKAELSAHKSSSASLKKQMAQGAAGSRGKKGDKFSAAEEASGKSIQPKDVAEAMKDHADQLTKASLSRLAAASRLLHFVSLKVPSSVVWNTLSVSSPVLSILMKESQPHTISVPALTTTSILLCLIPPLLGASNSHLIDLFSMTLKLAITGKPKVRKRAIRTVHVVLAHFQTIPNSPAYEQICKATDAIVQSGFKHTSATNTSVTLYTLELIKHTIFNVPTKTQQKWCTACLALPALCSPLLTQCTFLVFQSLFESIHKPHSTGHSKQQDKESHQHKDHDDDEEDDDDDVAANSKKPSSSNKSSSQSKKDKDSKKDTPISAATLPTSSLPNNGAVRLDKSQKKLIVQLTNSIFDIQPAPLDVGPTEAFCAAISEAFLCFSLLDEPVSALTQKLPKLFTSVVPILKGGNTKSATAACEALKKVLSRGISDSFINADLQHIEREGSPERVKDSTLFQIVSQLVEGLQVAYHDSWPEIFEIISALFERLGLTTLTTARLVNFVDAQQRQAAINLIIEPLMARISSLRATDQQLRKKTDPVLSHALLAIGIQNFLSHIPIGFPNPLTGDLEGQNLWLLAFFREHLTHAEISFFYNEMIPSTKLLAAFSGQLTKAGRDLGAKHLSTMHDQIWAIFPRFCHSPRDLSDAFALMAETIGLTIEDANTSTSVRMDLVHGLTSLITRTQSSIEAASKAVETFKEAHPEIGGTMDSDEVNESAEELQNLQDREAQLRNDLAAVQGFSSNFLPLLFNVYVSQITADLRNAVFACVEAFLTISGDDLINPFYTTILSALLTSKPAAEAGSQEAADEELHTMQCLTSLSVAFVPYLSSSNLSLLFKTIKPNLRRASQNAKPVDYTLQKKSWKVLKAICEFSSEFAIAHLSDIQALLAYAEMVGTSKLFVIKAMTQLMEAEKLQAWLQGRDKSFVSKISSPKHSVLTPLPTVVAGWKEASSKTRQAAAGTLEAIGRALGPEKLIALLVIGLSSDDGHHKAATISCFTLVVQRFSKELATIRNGQQLHSLLQTATLLLDLQVPEVRGATLAFIRAAINPTPALILQQALPSILHKLMDWPDPVKTKFNRDIRFLLEKFIKRLEYEVVAKAMPKAHIKFLQNINQRFMHAKKMAKQGKKKQADGDSSDEEYNSDSDAEKGENAMQVDGAKRKGDSKRKTAGKGDAAWLMEDGGEAPLDFTDPSANRSVVTVDPVISSRQSRPTSNPFATAEDGRLVISESVYKSSKGGNARAGIVSDELADDVEGRLIATKKRKRAHEASELADSDDETSKKPNAMSGIASSSSGEKKPWFTSKGVNDRPKKAKLDPTASAKSQTATYKSARAGGDSKVAGKADPHAYVKPNPAFLNKRHKNQSVKQYEALIGKKSKR